ncbi:MCM domain containing protein [Cryptosporidium hominis]|uniref:DNA replication licensing factor MCM3 n=1 Tax=Cryptosporidium hominis TaxID=237895 RepID=A0ABX5BCL1_CRYHO|nr:replication origin activator 2 [Cryptosporidium hominis TU502]PPS95157.1 MCM domain containing protein [Cryptosporidium hominis]|eukprot:PPS95157.1 MCM domain containing protein [Cryptosporidium hominis]
MLSSLSDSELSEQLIQVYKSFLQGNDEYSSKIKQMAVENIESGRILIELGDLRNISDELPQKIINEPYLYVSPFEEVIKDLVDLEREIDKNSPLKSSQFNARVGFSGWFGRNHLTPRGLTASNINKMVCVEGIISQCSIVKPKLVKSVHISKGHLIGQNDISGGANQAFVEVRGHRDISCLIKDRYIQSGVPSEDGQGNKMEVEIGLCRYKDTQKMTLQELPEMIPTGQLPRSIEIIAEDDLVETIKPGDRVKIVGVYKPISRRENNALTGIFKVVIVANNIQLLNKNVTSPELTPQEIRIMKEISNRDDTFEILSRSFASSLCGHEYIKKGLLLGILGGAEHNLENGTHIRGDIHTLLIGEPSCGKSQLLRFVMSIAPLAISTTGRGCSGVGLTAAVTHDPDTKERRLEAGATVLADRGIVCIDEFDKMSFSDRVAIHEVMEQQRVTIAKAGIQASLNARCSIFAAANPVYGHFDDFMELSRQIAFPDSLLSRFDLIFIVKDSRNSQQDRKIAAQVLAQVRYNKNSSINDTRTNKANNNFVIQPEYKDSDLNEKNEVNDIWQPPSNKIADKRSQNNSKGSSGDKVLTTSFLRKYIHYCKYVRNTPKLTDEAAELVARIFTELRAKCMNQSKGGTTCTTRTLEGIIRLATAHSKLKMRDSVIPEDVLIAFELLSYAMFGEVIEKESLLNVVFEKDIENELQQEDNSRNKRREEKKYQRSNHPSKTPELNFLEENEHSIIAPPPSSIVTPSREKINRKESAARGHQVALAAANILREESNTDHGDCELADFKKKFITSCIAEQFSESGLEAMLEEELLKNIISKSKEKGNNFMITNRDIKEVLRILEEENRLMIAGDTIYSIV